MIGDEEGKQGALIGNVEGKQGALIGDEEAKQGALICDEEVALLIQENIFYIKMLKMTQII